MDTWDGGYIDGRDKYRRENKERRWEKREEELVGRGRAGVVGGAARKRRRRRRDSGGQERAGCCNHHEAVHMPLASIWTRSRSTLIFSSPALFPAKLSKLGHVPVFGPPPISIPNPFVLLRRRAISGRSRELSCSSPSPHPCLQLQPHRTVTCTAGRPAGPWDNADEAGSVRGTHGRDVHMATAEQRGREDDLLRYFCQSGGHAQCGRGQHHVEVAD
ncbi:hypothetical protein BDQ17DRAFT_1330531 [Cyathus striatus]|nr:hypothetical protein BDQ17DRAFT_1330531 [Cyathus striatus]